MSRFWLYVASNSARVKIVSVVFFILLLVMAHNIFKPISAKMTLSQLDPGGDMRRVEFVVFDLNFTIGNLVSKNICLGYVPLFHEDDREFSDKVIADYMQSTMRYPLRDDDLAYKVVKFIQIVLPLLLAAVIYVLLDVVRRRAIAQGLCFGCGYSLIGLDSVVCPECGKRRDL